MASERLSALRPVVDDLQRIFGSRLAAVVLYGVPSSGPAPSLVLVESLTFDDLQACAERTRAWQRAGAAPPLLLPRAEFARSLDAFPIEYGEIIRTHEVAFGSDPFVGLTIDVRDLRRACEVQAKSHLLHLREDFLEGGGRHGAVEALVRDSAPAFAALLGQVARLDDVAGSDDLVHYATTRLQLDPRTVGDLLALTAADGQAPVDPVKLFPAYLAAMERLADFVDRWHLA